MRLAVVIPLLLSAYLWANASLSVETFDEQLNNPSQQTLRLRLRNSSNDTIRNVYLKYFMEKFEGKTLSVTLYYPAGLNYTLDTLEDFYVLQLNFSLVPPGFAPNESGVSLGINYTDWSDLHKDSHYSYNGGSTFEENDRVALFVDGVLTAGITPLLSDMVKVRFTGIKPESLRGKSPWIEIENFDSTYKLLNGFTLRNGYGNTVFLDSITILPNQRLFICGDSLLSCPAGGIFRNISLARNGEIALYFNSVPVDYLAWGEGGWLADSVRRKNEPVNTELVLDTKTHDVFGPVNSYSPGNFYRAVISQNGNIERWALYQDGEMKKEPSQLPDARPLSLSDGSVVVQDNNEEMSFAWVPVEGAESYRLTVLNAEDSTVAARRITSQTSEVVSLEEGDYLWNVSSYGSVNDIDEKEETDSQIFYRISKASTLSSYSVGFGAYVRPLAARKDSYMLNLKWGNKIDAQDWDIPHTDNIDYDENGELIFVQKRHSFHDREEWGRCWVVGAAMLNYYYGGDLTQDEIKFQIKSGEDKILEAFLFKDQGTGDTTEIRRALIWALNLQDTSLAFVKNPSLSYILNTLENRKPVYLGTGAHVVILDSARYNDRKNGYEIRFVNTDNNGHREWRFQTADTISGRAWVPVTTNPRMSNPLVSMDTDGDGVMDFDEIYRFGTDPENADTDGDGIGDKTEIASYTRLESFTEYGVMKETFADVDGDGLRAERDDDSDNGGIPDGEEDMNRNGLIDENETSPYTKYDDMNTDNLFVPSEFTLYALSRLSINDGVKCFGDASESNYCSIASAGDSLSGICSINVGVNAYVGNVYSRGKVYLRSNSRINGNIYLTVGASIWDNWLNNHTQISGEILTYEDRIWKNEYPITYKLRSFENSSIRMDVKSGESYHLKEGDKLSLLKVEAGGMLFVGSGEIWVDSLQIDKGAKMVFLNPGSMTVLHVNRKLLCRGTIDNVEKDFEDIAKGFKLVLHGQNKNYFIDELFAGTIMAPYSAVIVGQSAKRFYGVIVADKIIVHQQTKIYHINFEPVQQNQIALKKGALR